MMQSHVRLRRAALALPVALLLVGCAGGGQEPVQQVTVGGVPDSQRSLAPDEVLEARRAAGIADCPTSDLTATARKGGLPALTLDCMGGDTKVNLAGLPAGRPRVVNLWAQWCDPCEKEAPALGEVSKELADSVDFLGINYSDPFIGKAIDFTIQFSMAYPQLVDPKSSSRVPLQVPGPGMTLFVDEKGTVVHRETKPFSTPDELRESIREHLGVTA